MKRVMYSRISLCRCVRGCMVEKAPCRVSTDGLKASRRKEGFHARRWLRVIVGVYRAKRQEEGCRPYGRGRGAGAPCAVKFAASHKACRFARPGREKVCKVIECPDANGYSAPR